MRGQRLQYTASAWSVPAGIRPGRPGRPIVANGRPWGLAGGLLRVVEDHAGRVPVARAHAANTVAHCDAVGAAAALRRAIADRPDNGVALADRYHLDTRLHPRPLFGDDELTAREFPSRIGEQGHHLQWKDVLAVDILVQRIEIAFGVAQQ